VASNQRLRGTDSALGGAQQHRRAVLRAGLHLHLDVRQPGNRQEDLTRSGHGPAQGLNMEDLWGISWAEIWGIDGI